MYENQTFDVILERLLNNVTAKVDKSEGSLVYDSLAPCAKELEQCYIQLDEILKRAFAQTSYENYLDMKANEFGITRNQGVNAVGEVTFNGANSIVVPANTLVQSDSGLQYTTVEDATIVNGTATVKVTASNAGIVYNVPVNTINSLPVSITGIVSVTNNYAITGGADTETDASLLARLLLAVQLPSTSGNIADYEKWALSVPGVGTAKVFSLWNGNGTVKVVIADANKQPANQDLINSVSANIEKSRPIGATVTVESATALSMDISAVVVLKNGYPLQQAQADFNTAIKKYLANIAFNSNTVSYAQIGNILINIPGITDYSKLTVNGSASNIALADEQIPVVETINLGV